MEQELHRNFAPKKKRKLNSVVVIHVVNLRVKDKTEVPLESGR